MVTYTLSIEDRVRDQEGKVTQCVIMVNGPTFKREATYNPNKETAEFNPNGPFDTSFSIVHPFRDVARQVVETHQGLFVNEPELKYDSSVKDAQKTLFENIFKQEYEKARRRTIDRFMLSPPLHVASSKK